MSRLAARYASEAVPPVLRVPLRLGPAQVVVAAAIDEKELRRRHRQAAAPILDLDLANLLLTMPLGSAVSAAEFSDHDRRLLRIGNAIGAVEVLTGAGVDASGVDAGGVSGVEVDEVVGVIRRAVPPVQVRHVTVSDARWRRGLRMTSRFAPYASRELLLDQCPDDDVKLRLEATYLGIGISVRDATTDTRWRRLVEPAPFVPARYTGASWLFAERLLAGRAPVAGCTRLLDHVPT